MGCQFLRPIIVKWGEKITNGPIAIKEAIKLDRDDKEIVGLFHNHHKSWVMDSAQSINNHLILGDEILTTRQHTGWEEKTAQGESRFTFTHISSIEQ